MFEIGSTLREARMRQGLELHDAERATRIRAKYLAALEDERFDALPAEVYAKAFLRTYADYLGLNGDLYVEELNARFEASRPPSPLPEPKRRLSLPALDLRGAVVLGAAVAVVVVAVLAWRFGTDGREHRRALWSSPPPPATTPATTRGERRETTTRARHPGLVFLAARGDCWLSIRVRSAEGRVLYEGLLVEGKSRRFPAERLWVRIGAPWNLEATLNGKTLRLPVDTGNILVTPAGLRPA